MSRLSAERVGRGARRGCVVAVAMVLLASCGDASQRSEVADGADLDALFADAFLATVSSSGRLEAVFEVVEAEERPEIGGMVSREEVKGEFAESDYHFKARGGGFVSPGESPGIDLEVEFLSVDGTEYYSGLGMPEGKWADTNAGPQLEGLVPEPYPAFENFGDFPGRVEMTSATPDTVDGREMTRLDGTTTSEGLMSLWSRGYRIAASNDDPELAARFGRIADYQNAHSEVSVSAWIDSDGRLVRLHGQQDADVSEYLDCIYLTSGHAEFDLRFADLGADITIAAPPADELVDPWSAMEPVDSPGLDLADDLPGADDSPDLSQLLDDEVFEGLLEEAFGPEGLQQLESFGADIDDPEFKQDFDELEARYRQMVAESPDGTLTVEQTGEMLGDIFTLIGPLFDSTGDLDDLNDAIDDLDADNPLAFDEYAWLDRCPE